MQLLVVRHAIAEERSDWALGGQSDSLRPLTSKGRSRMKRNASALCCLVPDLQLIATSPFPRASETAAILSTAYDRLPVEEVPALASGASHGDLLDWLATRHEKSIAVVGHEPDLGRLVAWLLAGEGAHPMALRKGGACLLRFRGHPHCGEAELRWFLPPAVLRRIHP